MNASECWALLREAGSEWWADKAPRLGAALAFYITLSLAPLLILVVAIAGLVFGREAAEGQLIDQLRVTFGQETGATIQTMIANAGKPASGTVAAVTGVAVLVVGALGVFGQLQDALNTIWRVEPPPHWGLWRLVRLRLLSFSMVLGTAFLLLVSLVVSAALTAVSDRLVGEANNAAAQLGHFVLSLLVAAGLFAMLYCFLPDRSVSWRDAWFAAIVASALFNAGKFLFGLYLSRSAISSTFGAAGSLAVLLMWVYCSAQIFLFGAELSRASARRRASRDIPRLSRRPAQLMR